jgi:uncharacterized glyoxalase superfamily protein PhnB
MQGIAKLRPTEDVNWNVFWRYTERLNKKNEALFTLQGETFMAKKAERAVPQGMNTVTLFLSYKNNCREAIEFYKNAFDAKVLFEPIHSPDGRVLHAMIKIGDTNIMMSDSFEKKEQIVGNMAQMWIYVDDCDALFNRAVKAGCKVAMEMGISSGETEWGRCGIPSAIFGQSPVPNGN